MGNLLLLGGDGPFDEIANGDDADDVVAVDDGEVAHAAFGHEAHGILDGVGGRGDVDGRGHDFLNGGFPGGTSLKDDLAGVVALGDDADERAIVNDEERADAVVRHAGDGVEDGSIGGDAEDGAAFPAQNSPDSGARLHEPQFMPEVDFRRAVKWRFMPELLTGKTALILGVANRWSLAYAIAKAYRREGASLILTYQGERQQKTVEELGDELGAARVLACDVTKDEEIAALAEALGGTTLHAVVHSIAFANREDLARPFLETSRAGFALAHDVSAYSLVAIARATAPLMREGGAVLTLSYLGAQRVVQNYNVMGVAKAALESAMRYLAADLGPAGIRVNAISAGPVKTASARGVKDLTKVLDAAAAISPLRKQTDPAEVADTAVFLASELGRGVTGNVIFVDAGFHIIGLSA